MPWSSDEPRSPTASAIAAPNAGGWSLDHQRQPAQHSAGDEKQGSDEHQDEAAGAAVHRLFCS